LSQPLGKKHPTIRRIRELRRDAAFRQDQGAFVAEGIHLTAEALASGAPIECILASPRLHQTADGPHLLTQLEKRGQQPKWTSDAVLEGLQDARGAQPVLAVVSGRLETLDGLGDPLTTSQAPLIVIAHGVQDPGNLGSLWRTANGAGADALIACGQSADLLHPRTIRASAGAVFRLQVARAEADEVLEWLAARSLDSVGTDPSAGEEYSRAKLTGPLGILLGGEGAGLPSALKSRLDRLVRIPLSEGVESLSVGAAAAVVLFEAARQRCGS
jgi:TrmH family RNA methyltransferase